MNKKQQKSLDNFINRNEVKLEKLRDFILDNHFIVDSYHNQNYNQILSIANNKREVIKLMFLHALGAAGGNVPLDEKYNSYIKFCKNLEKLSCSSTFSFKKFAECFIGLYKGPSSLNDLIGHFSSGHYPHLRDKKSRLFIKELVLVAGDSLFSNFRNEKYIEYLSIPIDIVIKRVYSKIRGIPFKKYKNYDSEIHYLAKILFENTAIIFDDVWFWGHFSFRREKLYKIGNKKMIETDPLILGTTLNEGEILERTNRFITILKS